LNFCERLPNVYAKGKTGPKIWPKILDKTFFYELNSDQKAAARQPYGGTLHKREQRFSHFFLGSRSRIEHGNF
jgi:hypothetical protein